MKMNERFGAGAPAMHFSRWKKVESKKYFKALGINCFNESNGLMIVCGSRFETFFIRVTFFLCLRNKFNRRRGENIISAAFSLASRANSCECVFAPGYKGQN